LVHGYDGCVGEDGKIFGGDFADVVPEDQWTFYCRPCLWFSKAAWGHGRELTHAEVSYIFSVCHGAVSDFEHI